MWEDLFRAIALVMVIEGILPFVAPDRWREMIARVQEVDARSLRIFGAMLMISGLLLLNFLAPD